jgi:hypothetical protein
LNDLHFVQRKQAGQNSHATVNKSCREEDIIQFFSPEQYTAAKMHDQCSAINDNNHQGPINIAIRKPI